MTGHLATANSPKADGGHFSHDTASDVRDGFRDLIGEALSTEQAFWLGLAVTQWKCGRLLERVKEKAARTSSAGREILGAFAHQEILSKISKSHLIACQAAAASLNESKPSSTLNVVKFLRIG